MREIYKKILFTFLLLVLSNASFAQIVNLDDIYATRPEVQGNRLRQILNKFTIGFGVGYGMDNYEASLVGFDTYYLSSQNQPLITSQGLDPNATGFLAYKNWMTKPELITSFPPLASPDQGTIPRPMNQSFNTSPLTTESLIKLNTEGVGDLNYTAIASNIPIQLTTVYNFQDKFRIGFGIEFVKHRLKYLNPNSTYNNQIESIHPEISTWVFRYYGVLGMELWKKGGFVYALDLEVGTSSFGDAFDETAVKPSVFVSVGLPIEREFSQYFRIFLRPSYDIKSYTVAYPAIPEQLKVSQNGFNFTFGVKIRIPEIKRCSTYHCETQIKHQHKDKMYRGQPIYLPQNPKVGQIPKGFQEIRWKKKY